MTIKDRIDEDRLSRIGKKIYKGRKDSVEHSFADANQNHGHCYAGRGLDYASE